MLGAWRLMDPPLALQHEVEMLHGVRDVDGSPVDSDIAECSIEQPSRRSNERFSFPVLLIARLLTHHDHARGLRPLSEDGLRGPLPQFTGPAPGRSLSEP